MKIEVEHTHAGYVLTTYDVAGNIVDYGTQHSLNLAELEYMCKVAREWGFNAKLYSEPGVNHVDVSFSKHSHGRTISYTQIQLCYDSARMIRAELFDILCQLQCTVDGKTY